MREYRHAGVDREEARGRFAEGVELVRLGLSENRFSFHGEYFHVDETSVHPRLRNPSILDNMNAAFMTKESAEVAAKLGLGMHTVTGKPPLGIQADIRMFNTARSEIGLPPIRPVVSLIVYCRETDAEAQLGAQYLEHHSLAQSWNYGTDNPDLWKGVKGFEHYYEGAKSIQAKRAEEAARGTLPKGAPPPYELYVSGTPDKCLARMLEIQQETSAREFVISVMVPSTPLEEQLKSIDMFARYLLPTLHEIDPSESELYV